MMKSRGERILDGFLLLLALAALVILYAPFMVSVVFSIVPIEGNRILWDTPTLAWYARIWDDPLIVEAIKTTILVGLLAVLAAVVVAVGLALYLTSETVKARWFIETLIYLPFLLPPIVTGLALLVFFEDLSIGRNLATIVVGHVIFILAVIYRLVSARLESLSRSFIEASADLGATRWQTFRYVLWPQISPAVATSAVLAFALSFDETLITSFLSGSTMTLPLRLWAMMRVGFTPAINALVTLVILASAILTITIVMRLKPKEDVQE